MEIDGRPLKLLVIDDYHWGIRARDLGVQVLLMPGPLNQEKVAAVVEQEGCHGVIAAQSYQLNVPSWSTGTEPQLVVAQILAS